MKENILDSDRFKFERKSLDFPFYNNNPHLNYFQWTIMLLGILGMIIIVFFIDLPSPYKQILLFLVPTIGFGIASNWKFNLICKKFRRNDAILIPVLLILGIISSALMAFIVQSLGFIAQPNPAFNELNSITFWLSFPFQLFGEELLKIVPFLFTLFLVYNFTKNRKLAIIIGLFVAMVIFGLLHYPAYNNIVSVLLVQGFAATIFMMYAYIKTKNILVSFIIHLLTDLIPFTIALLH